MSNERATLNEQTSGRSFDWAQVDVFAESPLAGNMLAIFPDARGLSDTEMQALARETNLSETTFVLPGDPATDQEHGIRVRIFTTLEELPFAGHPTLGTASWLRHHHPAFAGMDEVRLLLDVGPIPVRFHDDGGPGSVGTMRQRDPEFSGFPDPEPLARALGFAPADLHPTLRPQIVSTGLPFAIVPLCGLQALSRLHADMDAVTAALQGSGAAFAYCVAPGQGEGAGARHWRARLRLYDGEDPATGSAAGNTISYLVRHGAVPSGAQVVIEQGIEMGRPSRIITSAHLDGDRVTDVSVSGRTIPVATGRFILP